MALEDAIRELTAALTRNSDILESGLKKSQSASSSTPAATSAKPAASKPAASGSRKAKTPSDDDIRTAFGGYLAVKDRTEKEARKANVRSILDHFGVSLASEIAAESRAEAIEYVKQLEAGETPNFMNEGDGEGEGDDDDGESLI